MEQPAPPPSFFQYCDALSNRIHHCRPHTYKLCPDHIQAGPTDLSGAHRAVGEPAKRCISVDQEEAQTEPGLGQETL